MWLTAAFPLGKSIKDTFKNRAIDVVMGLNLDPQRIFTKQELESVAMKSALKQLALKVL